MPILVESGYVAGSQVDLDTLWMNAAVDLTDMMAFPQMSALSVSTTVSGEVRAGASGRLRMVRTSGAPRTAEATLPWCDRGQIAWLETHVGQAVCVRDDRGRKFYGVYLAVEVAEQSQIPSRGDASVTFNEITFSEQV